MAYKDKEKQREAVKAATRRYRANKGDSALSVSKQVSQKARGLSVVDEVGDTRPVIPKDVPTVKDLADEFVRNSPKRGKDIKCITIGDQVRSMKTMAMLHSAAVTGKPGDADYNGVCTEAWRAERGR